MRLTKNWIGGGATRPITQVEFQYNISAALWVNNLDGRIANKAEKVLSTPGDTLKLW